VRYRLINASTDSYLNVRMAASSGRFGVDERPTYLPLSVPARDGVPVNWNEETGQPDPAGPQMVQRDNVFLPPGGRDDLFVAPNTRATIIGSASISAFCTGALAIAIPTRAIVSIVPRSTLLHRRSTLTALPQRPRLSPARPTRAALFARLRRPTGIERAITFTEYQDSSFYVTQTGNQTGVSANGRLLRASVLAPSGSRAAGAVPDPVRRPFPSRHLDQKEPAAAIYDRGLGPL
jgi:hypothetical protein